MFENHMPISVQILFVFFPFIYFNDTRVFDFGVYYLYASRTPFRFLSSFQSFAMIIHENDVHRKISCLENWKFSSAAHETILNVRVCVSLMYYLTPDVEYVYA